MEPRISRFGEAVTREGGPLRRAADPFNVSSVVEGPVADELQRLGVEVTLPSATVAVPGELTRSQETAAKQRRGRARRALATVPASPPLVDVA